MTVNKRYVTPVFVVFAILGGLVASGHFGGLTYNHTASAPVGLWIETNEPVRYGSWVKFCPPEDAAYLARERQYIKPGSCPGGIEPLMKKVVGVPGEWVHVAREGVKAGLNGFTMPASSPMEKDSDGQVMPLSLGDFALREGEFWVMGIHSKSYDSRYYGPIKAESIIATMKPLVLF